jgi:hypothetical protein
MVNLSSQAVLRHFRAARGEPRSFGIFVLGKLSRLVGCRMSIEYPTEIELTKDAMRRSGKNVGHVTGQVRYVIKFRGKRLLDFPVGETEANLLNFFYLRDPGPVAQVVRRLERDGVLKPSRDWVIFEPGCNLGKMLFHFRDAYGSRILGADVYGDAIRLAKRIALEPEEQFHEADLLQSEFLSSRPDRCFDLTVISSHLVHVMDKPGFARYLEQLRRVSKRIVIHERASPELEALLEKAMPGIRKLGSDPLTAYWSA